MKEETRKKILDVVLESQDLGGKAKERIHEAINTGVDSDRIDPLSKFLMDSVMDKKTIDEVKSDLDYGIAMLTRAKQAVLKIELEVFDVEALGLRD